MAQRKLSQKAAKALNARLHLDFQNLEDNLIRFISGQGWIALGYKDAYEWWTEEKFSKYTLAKEIHPHIVFAMLADGRDDMEIALGIKGVGPETVSEIRRQKSIGIPANKAKVNGYLRSVPPNPPDTLHLKVGARVYRRLKEQAALAGKDLEKEAIFAIKEHWKTF